MPRPVFRTSLCDLFGIDYPIVQSGMGGAAGPDLAAAVSNAGGLGIIAGNLQPPDRLRDLIRTVREQTDRPFGVNILLADEILSPPKAASVSDVVYNDVNHVLNSMRETFGLPQKTTRPSDPSNRNLEAIDVIMEERVPVFSVGLGNPGSDVVEECHRRDIKVIAMVTKLEDALAVEDNGLDAVIAQGTEAGGHRSHFVKPAKSEHEDVGTMALVPEVAAAVGIPVIAAGGLINGRSLVAALSLGASGVLMGTRFVATRESMVSEAHKRELLESTADKTALTDVLTGRYARALRNAFIDRYEASGAPVLPFGMHHVLAEDIRLASVQQDNKDYQFLWSGQGVGLIHDLPSAGEVMASLIQEARELMMKTLPQTVKLEA